MKRSTYSHALGRLLPRVECGCGGDAVAYVTLPLHGVEPVCAACQVVLESHGVRVVRN